MWKNLILIPTSLIVFFFMVEAGARFWFTLPKPYSTKPGILVFDTRGFWVLEPEYRGQYDNGIDFQAKNFSITKYGTRLVPCMPINESTGNRIFLIGDSQTFGVGLADEETWANLLQCRLNDSPGGPWKVHNMGVPATNIDQYYARTAGMLSNIVRPGDQVIVSVTWNDLHTSQANSFVRRIVRDSQLLEQSGTEPPRLDDGMDLLLAKPLRRLGEPTWRYWLYQRTGIFVPSFDSLGGFISSAPYASVLLGNVLPKARLLYYRHRDSGVLAKKVGPETINNNFQILSALSVLIKRRGGRLIVNLLPNRLFFDDYYYWSYSQGRQGFPAQDYMMYLAKQHCARFELECVTSFPALKTSTRDAHTFSFDGHFNKAGASRIAEFLFRYLTAEPKR
ncbi:MAG: SGNH/GDSL hydrolase family protein [Rhodospirillales bacterium]|nr:SGNH/GDSL hydrolase family protein [Rhodospirillales bacterium]